MSRPTNERRRRRPASHAEFLEPRRLLASTPALIQDINQTTEMLDPERFMVVGGQAYFAGRGVDGADSELWKTDGTRAGTVMVKDINPGLPGSTPTNFTEVNGVVYFTARHADSGLELWKTDGTDAGTVLVKDMRPGTADASPANLTNFGGVLFFTANDGVGGTELWRSDGTPEGTARVKEIRPGSTGSDPRYLVEYDGMLLFSADDGAAGRELWRSDGSPEGTVRVADIYPGISGGNPSHLVRFDDAVFFAADPGNGVTSTRGDLYRTDGLTVTRVKEINAGGTGFSDYSTLLNFVPSGDRLYFLAGNINTGSYDLWVSNGTDGGTLRLLTGNSGLRFNPMVPAGQRSLVFAHSTTANGKEVWKSDGTSVSTTRLTDLLPGAGNGVDSVVMAAAADRSAVYFAPNRFDGTAELWRTQLTPATTVPVADLKDHGVPGILSWLSALGDKLLFTGLRYVDQGDLFVSDGTAGGTYRLGAAAQGNASSMMEYPTINEGTPAFFPAPDGSGAMYFSASDGLHGHELWRTVPGPDGAPTGATLFADLAPGGYGSDPAGFSFTLDGSVYFTATTPALGRELYRIAPGASAPQLVADLAPAAQNSVARNFSTAGDALYFTAWEVPDSTLFFWRYHPSTSAPVKMTNASGQALTRGTPLVRAGDYWYFAAEVANLAGSSRLWRTDGTSNVAQQVTAPVSFSSPTLLTAVGDTLFFTATDSAAGRELWKLDTGSAQPTRVSEVTPGSGSTDFQEMFAHRGALYFSAMPDTTGSVMRPWRSDGTAGGTRPISDALSIPQQFTALGEHLYFIANDAQGTAVFRHDPAGAAADAPLRLTPTSTGSLPLRPRTLFVAGGKVYIVALAGASRGDHVELWQTAGSPASTENLRDVQPIVPAGSSPGLGGYWFAGRIALGASATHLFLPVWNPQTGLEPHALAFDVVVDNTPPTITAAGPDPARPSHAVQITFSEDVSASLEHADLQLVNQTTGQPIDPQSVAVTFDPQTLTATFTFPGLAGGLLPDGDYRATLLATGVTDAANNPLARDHTFDFHAFAADNNRDRRVDFNDLAILAQTYNQSNTNFATGDLDGDGKTDFNDLALLAQRYNTVLPNPPAATTGPAQAQVWSDESTPSIFSTRPITKRRPVARTRE